MEDEWETAPKLSNGTKRIVNPNLNRPWGPDPNPNPTMELGIIWKLALLTRITDPNRPATLDPDPIPNPNRPTTRVLTLTDPRGGEFLEHWH